MTSTATRVIITSFFFNIFTLLLLNYIKFDLNGIPAINKRSTTPSGLTSANKSALNKKFNNIRQSPDDSIFISKSFIFKNFVV